MGQIKNIYYFVPTHLEYQRYIPDALDKYLKPIVYQNHIFEFIKIIFCLRPGKKILLNGNRIVDIFIISECINRGLDVNVIQHGSNLYKSNKLNLLQFINKTFFNKVFWSVLLSLFFLRIINIFSRSGKLQSRIRIFYFTPEFKNFFIKNFGNTSTLELEFIEYKTPNPLTWGTVKNINTIPFLKNFYIDEPLSATLGLSNGKEIIEILKTLPDDEILHIKPHPRSSYKKFVNIDKIKLTQEVPLKTKRLFGFKSNLLNYEYSFKEYYQIQNDGTVLKGEFKFKKNTKKLTSIEDITYENLL